jgi:Sulfotransferase family
MMRSATATRAIYEPSNIRQQLFVGGEPHLLPLPLAGPGDDLGADGRLIGAALRGSTSTRWTNPARTDRVVQRRVIKDVRTVGALPWIADRFPTTPVVLLIRHPIAVAHSIIELGWGLDADLTSRPELRDRPELIADLRAASLALEVSRWCAHHHWALSHPAAQRAHVILYEELALDPVTELERLSDYLADFEHWDDWRPDPAAIHARSVTSFRRAESSGEAWVDSWSAAWSHGEVTHAAAIVDAAGLGGVYGTGPMPLISGAQVHDVIASPRAGG